MPAGASSTGAQGGVGGGAMQGSSSGTGGGPLVSSHYTLSEYVGPQIWTQLTRTAAVDAADRLFVTDGQTVFVVEDGVPSIYLSPADLQPANADAGIISMDVGPDDRLYILDRGVPAQILVSRGPHDVSILHGDLSAARTFPALLAVESPDRIFVVSHYDGLFEVTPNGIDLLYGESAIDASGCAAEDLAVSQDGRLFYLPGCNGSPLLSGLTDGSGVGILKHEDALDEYYFWMFGGIARNPPGGVMVNLVGTIYHIGTDGTATELNTTPTLNDVTADWIDFHARPIEVGPTGNVYVISTETIYRAVPD
ncbi:hypothetical protein [Sorangium cellulosum]|nr:hypothetical protein [Sorangium cellulosum]